MLHLMNFFIGYSMCNTKKRFSVKLVRMSNLCLLTWWIHNDRIKTIFGWRKLLIFNTEYKLSQLSWHRCMKKVTPLLIFTSMFAKFWTIALFKIIWWQKYGPVFIVPRANWSNCVLLKKYRNKLNYLKLIKKSPNLDFSTYLTLS